MRSSILAMSVIPAVAVLSLMGWVAIKIVRALTRKQPIRILHAVVLVIGFILVDAVISLILVISAGLSHSEEAKAGADKLCLLSFLLLVVFPGALIFYLAYRSRARSTKDRSFR